MYRAATECKRQAELAQFQSGLTDKRRQEAEDHSTYIGNLPNDIGYATIAKRYLKAGNIEGYAKKADKQVTELENVLAHVEKHWQETEAKINAYRSEIQKRRDARLNAITRENTVNQIFTESIVRATEAGTRTTDVQNRERATPIEDTTYRDIAERIIIGATSATDTTNIANLGLEARRARARARLARTRAEQAETRAEQAETRSRIDKAYNNSAISDEAAKKVAKFSKSIGKMEKKVAENARLINLNEKNIQSTFTDIENKIGEMQNITTAAGGAALTPGQLNDLQRLAGEIEKAEIAKNSAIAFDLQATTGEQTVLGNIINELRNESAALTSENFTETAITNLANQDPPHLQNLVNRQKKLVDILKGTAATATRPARRGLIELAKARAEVCHTLASTIKGGGPAAAPATILRHQWDEANYTRDFITQIRRFNRALQAVRPLEENAAPVLKRNAIHMERDIADDANKAIKSLQEIKNNLADQDDEGLKNRSKGHLFIDPKAGKFTLGDQAVWMWVREINGWGRPDYATVRTGQTRAEYRPDIVKIEIETVTREAGKLSVEPIDTKRLERRYFRSADYEYTLEVPGDTFAAGGRRQATLTIIDLKKQDGRTAKPAALHALTGPTWTAAEYTTIKTIDMEKAGTIRIKENHNNQNYPVETLVSFETQVMPDPLIDHAQALARRQGEGWSDKQKQHMWKIDLDRHVLSFPNGLEFSLDDFDWTETRWDEENGLTLRFKGPGKLFELNLLAAGSYDAFDPRLSDFISSLKKKQREHQETGIEWLKQSIRSYSEKKIDTALTSIKSTEGIMSYQSSVIQDELQKPPKNRLDLEKLRKKKKAQKDTRTPRWVATSLEGTADMLLARQSYESKVKELIQTIHKKNPLSAEYVWKSRARPDIYRIEKHTSSQKKLWLLNEIRAANHLDKTVSFPLLEDPKQGPASAVKNAKPNGLELLQEYNLYKNKQDFVNQTERQNVESYVANIETLFMTDANIDPYYANQWNFERALEAINRGEILSKDGVIGASDYIRNLKPGNRPLITEDSSIRDLRQADEYAWTTYLLNGLAEANAEHLPEVLQKSIPVALWMQRSRYGNLNLAEQALDLETTSDEAKWFIEDIDIVETPLPWSEPETDQKAKVDTTKDKNQFDPKTRTNKSEAELAQEAGRAVEQVYKYAVDATERIIDSIDDPVMQKRCREEVVKLISESSKSQMEVYKLLYAKQEKLEMLKLWDEKEKEWFYRDLGEKLALLWIQQGINGTNKGLKDAQDAFGKLIKQLLS
ncbi:MAG TPA: hypothetical protein VGL94_23485 [Ktedonobacteraceae bacterium]